MLKFQRFACVERRTAYGTGVTPNVQRAFIRPKLLMNGDPPNKGRQVRRCIFNTSICRGYKKKKKFCCEVNKQP